jgi:hypothetical protein
MTPPTLNLLVYATMNNICHNELYSKKGVVQPLGMPISSPQYKVPSQLPDTEKMIIVSNVS